MLPSTKQQILLCQAQGNWNSCTNLWMVENLSFLKFTSLRIVVVLLWECIILMKYVFESFIWLNLCSFICSSTFSLIFPFFILFFIFFTFSSPLSLFFLCLVVYFFSILLTPSFTLSLPLFYPSFLPCFLSSFSPFFLLFICLLIPSFPLFFFSCLPTFFPPSFFRAFSLLFFRSFFPSFLHVIFFHYSQSEALLTVHFSLHWTGNIHYT